MSEEKVINIEELCQDKHNFNQGTVGGGKTYGAFSPGTRGWPQYSDR